MTRERGCNILSYVDSSKICDVIKSFPELKQIIGNEDINFPIYSSSKVIEWKNEHLIEL